MVYKWGAIVGWWMVDGGWWMVDKWRATIPTPRSTSKRRSTRKSAGQQQDGGDNSRMVGGS